MIAALLGRLPGIVRITYVRYIAASAGALAVDLGLFLTLMASGAPAMQASATGYTAGILAHWLLSSRTVFSDSLAVRGRARGRQQALFLASALLGLALTALIVGGGDMLGVDPHLAKLVAVIISFQTTYLLRKAVVFSQ
ncbi:MAG: GtrA family protein [Sphingobium phenoxybenzoativorans]